MKKCQVASLKTDLVVRLNCRCHCWKLKSPPGQPLTQNIIWRIKRDVASPKRATKWAMNLNNSKYHWGKKKDVKLPLWKESQSGLFISIANAMMPLRESLFSNWDGVESTVGPLFEIALITECEIHRAFRTSAACQYFQYDIWWVLNLTCYNTRNGSTKDT